MAVKTAMPGSSSQGPASERSDDELVQGAKAGDPASVAEIYRRHADRLWREVIWPMVKDRARAQDVLCETFLAAMEALPRFELREPRPEMAAAGAPGGEAPASGSSLQAWLRQIARRKALDAFRGDARSHRLEERVLGEVGAEPPAPDQHEELAAREKAAMEAEHVEEVLAVLNPRYAEALRMRLQEGLSREDCAERLGIKLGTFDVLLHRAVKSFQKVYEERHGATAL
jgi:RNA polymerase sigma-70 factor (ECF subfamily)